MILTLKRIRFGYALSSLLLLISYILIISTNRRLQHENTWIANSYILVKKISDIKMTMNMAESHVRGYLISRRPEFMNKFYEDRMSISKLYGEVRRLIQNDTTHAGSLRQLEEMTRRRFADLNATLQWRPSPEEFNITPKDTLHWFNTAPGKLA